jgi:hypothetical protein
MAKSKYEYVREYEQDMRVARNNFIVVRIDGRGFHRFVLALFTLLCSLESLILHEELKCI